MGQVYAATDQELGRSVALKVIRPERVASSYARARLVREAQALALLHHPNVVMVHDVGAEGDNVFVAMELVDGVTLDDWLRAEPRIWPAIREVFLAAGRGLAAAHAAGIVHRDFKPHNVIVGVDRVVVIDLGLARADGDASDRSGDAAASAASAAPAPPDTLRLALTLTGERVGTPHYMAPEQRAGGAVTAKADQFAFCVALYEALSGDKPVEGAVLPLGSRVPRFVAAAIARGLSLDPEARWPSMEALLGALGRTFWTRRRKRLAGGAVTAALAAVAVLGFAAGQRVAAPDPCLGGEALIALVWTAHAGNTPARLSGLYGNRAAVLSRRGDHPGAIELYQVLVGIETDHRGPESLGVAWAHKNIGDELEVMGRGGHAAPHYQRASEMLENLLGPEHPFVRLAADQPGLEPHRPLRVRCGRAAVRARDRHLRARPGAR
jgi:hypothetical protein